MAGHSWLRRLGHQRFDLNSREFAQLASESADAVDGGVDNERDDVYRSRWIRQAKPPDDAVAELAEQFIDPRH